MAAVVAVNSVAIVAVVGYLIEMTKMMSLLMSSTNGDGCELYFDLEYCYSGDCLGHYGGCCDYAIMTTAHVVGCDGYLDG